MTQHYREHTEHNEDHDVHGARESHMAPTAHYYQKVARNKTIGRVLFVVITIVVLIIVFLLIKAARSGTKTIDSSLAADAVLTQGNVKYVNLEEPFDLYNHETAFIKDTEASVKIINYAYVPCSADNPKCVQKGVHVDYELVNHGNQYRDEYGTSVNTDLFPYVVTVVRSDYQNYATLIVSRHKMGTGGAGDSGSLGVNGSGGVSGGNTGGNQTGGSTNTGGNTIAQGSGEVDVSGIEPLYVWEKVIVHQRPYYYPSNWARDEIWAPSKCYGVHITRRDHQFGQKLGEIFMYDYCDNQQIIEELNSEPSVKKLTRQGVHIFILHADNDAAKAEVNALIKKNFGGTNVLN